MLQRILLVEPNVILAKTYASALEGAGYETAQVHDAQNAIACIDEFGPDLIILELQLAAHSGVEFLHELRSYQDWRHIPVVVLSYVLPQNFEAMRVSFQKDLGVDTFCYKPNTSLQKLIKTIRDKLTPLEVEQS